MLTPEVLSFPSTLDEIKALPLSKRALMCWSAARGAKLYTAVDDVHSALLCYDMLSCFINDRSGRLANLARYASHFLDKELGIP